MATVKSSSKLIFRELARSAEPPRRKAVLWVNRPHRSRARSISQQRNDSLKRKGRRYTPLGDGATREQVTHRIKAAG